MTNGIAKLFARSEVIFGHLVGVNVACALSVVIKEIRLKQQATNTPKSRK